MKKISVLKKSLLTIALLCPIMAQAEVLALVNYESKPGQTPQKEGLAIIDIDLESANFGKILENIPLPVGVVAHHVFYNKDVTNRRAILPHEILGTPVAKYSFTYGANWISPSTPCVRFNFAQKPLR